MPKTHRNRPPTNYSYPIGVVPSDPPTGATADAGSEVSPEPPAPSANKPAWEAYAEAVGVDPAGLTKAQIRKAVGA